MSLPFARGRVNVIVFAPCFSMLDAKVSSARRGYPERTVCRFSVESVPVGIRPVMPPVAENGGAS